jgi:peptidoglycan/xylan/chitin deacetylase (PgdA/CDA1 family)
MRATFFIFSGAIGSRDAFMNWGEVIEMHRRGMDIQSHTYTHPILTKESAQTIARELTKSKKQIEEKIGAPVIALAYPFGLFNDEIVGEVARAHYGIARTTRDSVWHSSNRLLTIGGTLSTDNLSDFEALLSR